MDRLADQDKDRGSDKARRNSERGERERIRIHSCTQVGVNCIEKRFWVRDEGIKDWSNNPAVL